jgi:hypothetical protein
MTVSWVDTGVVSGSVDVYEVDARNGFGASAPSLPADVLVFPGLLPVPPGHSPTPLPPADAFWVTRSGADPTGTTDSGPGIRAALAAAQAQVGGSHTVYFPEGIYLVTSFDPNVGPAFYLPVSVAAIVIQGAGRDITRVIGNNSLGKHLCQTQVDGCTVNDITFDTALFNGGTALTTNANNTTWNRVGGCTGADFGMRMVGVEAAHTTGNAIHDLYLDGGAQLEAADMDIDYQDGFVGTDWTHVGGRIALYYCGTPGMTGSQGALVDGYTYTASSRAHNQWGLRATRANGVTIQNSPVFRSGNESAFGKNASPAIVGDSLTWRNCQSDGSDLPLGDNSGILIDGCTLATITVNPFFFCEGTVVDTIHGAVAYKPQSPSAVIALTGL